MRAYRAGITISQRAARGEFENVSQDGQRRPELAADIEEIDNDLSDVYDKMIDTNLERCRYPFNAYAG
jgi:hypothetical protein